MKFPALVMVFFAAAASGNVAPGADVEIISRFEGNRGPGWKSAANVMGGMEPKHVVDFTIGGLRSTTRPRARFFFI